MYSSCTAQGEGGGGDRCTVAARLKEGQVYSSCTAEGEGGGGGAGVQ